MKFFYIFVFAFVTMISASAADEQVLPFVSPMFGDNMVLQRGKPNAIWGWAAPGEKVKVEIAGHSAMALAAADGRWQTKIQPPPTGGPYTLKISSAQQTVEFHDVLVGDVWLCGGQSNMEFGIGQARNGAEEIQAANHPEIRLFLVHQHVAYAPASVPEGQWKICSPQTIAEDGWGGFSAVGYYFGLKLENTLHVPIGLVEDCWGGTPVESWMSPKTLHTLKDFDAPLAEIARLHAKGGPEYGSFLMHWLDEYDIGNNLWSAENFDDSKWKTVEIPGGFKELGVADVPGICWFRKEITLPNPLPPGPATIYLGSIEKMDTTYINGQWVGASSWVENPRAYEI